MLLIRTLFSTELIALGLRDLRAHKLRSFLTGLGMIFGVGAVICMLSVGEGASAEQLEQIRLLGSDNIIIRSVEPPQSTNASQSNSNVSEYGIKQRDINRIRELPFIERVALMREVANRVTTRDRKFEGSVLGATRNFFDVVHIKLARGRVLSELDESRAAKVCVIGAEVARELFVRKDPLGEMISIYSRSTDNIPYRIVGVLADVRTAGAPAKGQGDRNPNRDVYIPFTTADRRYGELKYRRSSGSREIKRIEYSDVYVNVVSEDDVPAAAEMLKRLFEFGHDNRDYEIVVPLELLQQAENIKRQRQIVLGSIAGISLLVGGIGIMNIMLASVTERTREIGIRRALGAKRAHITAQFLIETVILSVLGGVIGILVGIAFAHIVSLYAGWETVVKLWGVALSFLVSAFIGISFGIYPARAAARLDPIVALRHE